MASNNNHISYIKLEKEREMKKNKIKKIILMILRYLIPGIAALLVIIPILAIVIASFKDRNAFLYTGAFELKGGFTLDNYKSAFVEGNLQQSFFNTLFISIVSIVLTIFISSMAAYILARFKFAGSKFVKKMFYIGSIVPGIVLLESTFRVIGSMELYNSYWAVILIFISTDLLPVFIYMQFIKEIPKSMDESAIVDGASFFYIYRKIIFPLLKPATITVIILNGIKYYNDFFTAHLYLPTVDHAVMSTALRRFNSQFSGRWEIISAGIVITMLPSLILFLIFRKQIYAGIANNASKK